MHLRFRIKMVDQYGYNGRDHHPSRHDVGKIVTPVKMDVMVWDDDDQQYGPDELDLGQEKHIQAANNLAKDGTARTSGLTYETMWTVVTEEGQILEMMDFELELESAGCADGMQFERS